MRRKNGSKPKDLRPISEKIESQRNLLQSTLEVLRGVSTYGVPSKVAQESCLRHLESIDRTLGQIASSIPDRKIDDAKVICEAVEIAVTSMQTDFKQKFVGFKTANGSLVATETARERQALHAMNLLLDALGELDASDTGHVYKAVRMIREPFIKGFQSIDLDQVRQTLGLKPGEATHTAPRVKKARRSKKVPF